MQAHGQDPEPAMQMLALSRRLRKFVSQVTELSLKEAPSRLAVFFLLKVGAGGSDTVFPDMGKGQVAY